MTECEYTDMRSLCVGKTISTIAWKHSNRITKLCEKHTENALAIRKRTMFTFLIKYVEVVGVEL